MSATLDFNNTRSNTVYIDIAINGGAFSGTLTKIPAESTVTNIDLGVSTLTELDIIVHKGSSGSGDGKGQLDCKVPSSESANSATALLGAHRDDVTDDACLVLYDGTTSLSATFANIDSTS